MNDSVKLLSKPVNFAVVQLPERQYPGVVVQGDTLAGYVSRLEQMKSQLEANDLEELRYEIDDLGEILTGALAFYQAVCKEHGIS
jgi:hypothetical protein